MKKNDFKSIAKLVSRVKAQDADAFVELYNCMYHKVYCLALSIVKDEYLAQDVVQETFINVYKNIHALSDDLMFTAWINRIGYHCSLKRIEKNEELPLDGAGANEEIAALNENEPLEVMLSKEKSRTIAEAILELSPEYKAVMIMKYYEGLKLEEIADCLECSVGTVKSRLSRGRRALRKRLGTGDRWLTAFFLCGTTLSFSIAAYAKANAMPATMAKRVLETGKTELGIRSAVSFCETISGLLPLVAIKGGGVGFLFLVLLSGGVLSSAKPDISIAYATEAYTNQAIPISIRVDSLIPIKTMEIIKDGIDSIWYKDLGGGIYKAYAPLNGSYAVKVTLLSGREAKKTFEVSNIDTGLPKLYGYSWNEQKNALHCLVSDDLSGVDYLKVYKQTRDGKRQLPIYSHEGSGEIGFSLSAAPFYIYLYDKGGNFAKYRIEPYEIKEPK